MVILIEILVFIGVGAGIAWAWVKNVSQRVSQEVKYKLHEREKAKSAYENKFSSSSVAQLSRPQKESFIGCMMLIALKPDCIISPMEHKMLNDVMIGLEDKTFDFNWLMATSKREEMRYVRIIPTLPDQFKDLFVMFSSMLILSNDSCREARAGLLELMTVEMGMSEWRVKKIMLSAAEFVFEPQ